MARLKKAFDSIDHNYLIKCLESLKLPEWSINFLSKTIFKWKINIMLIGEIILEKKIEKGILQSNSLSPLLFVLCIDPLSRKLNRKYQKVTILSEDDMYDPNHLLFIDDLKLLAESKEEL